MNKKENDLKKGFEKFSYSNYPRLQKILEENVSRDLLLKHPMKTIHEEPKLNALVVHASTGQAMKNSSSLLLHSLYVCMMTGQYPCVTKVKRPVSLFFMRHDLPIGVKVTLRRKILLEFLDKLVAHVLAKQQDVSLSERVEESFLSSTLSSSKTSAPKKAFLKKNTKTSLKKKTISFGCDFVDLFPEMEHFFVNVNMGCDLNLSFHPKKKSSAKVLASSVQLSTF